MTAPAANSTRISQRFAALRAAGELGIVAYITAGDPSLDATLKFVVALAEAGTDVDRARHSVQRSARRRPDDSACLRTRVESRHDAGGRARSGASHSAIKFRCERCSADTLRLLQSDFSDGRGKIRCRGIAVGADGVLVTDLTPEESVDYRHILAANNLDTVFLAAPTSTDERLKTIAGSDVRLPVSHFTHRRDWR